jgi:hypothetical protein
MLAIVMLAIAIIIELRSSSLLECDRDRLMTKLKRLRLFLFGRITNRNAIAFRIMLSE